jgi:hypothetical protein
MRRSTYAIGAFVVAVIAIAAISIGFVVSRSAEPAAPIRLAPPVASAVPAAPSSPPVNVAAEKSRPLKLGEKTRVDTEDGYVVDVAALRHRSGDGYEGVQVRVCNRGTVISVSRGPWMLGYDGFESVHDIDISGGGLPAPAYEDRDELREGQCAKGWINFSRVDGERPDGIQYSPQGAAPIRWEW